MSSSSVHVLFDQIRRVANNATWAGDHPTSRRLHVALGLVAQMRDEELSSHRVESISDFWNHVNDSPSFLRFLQLVMNHTRELLNETLQRQDCARVTVDELGLRKSPRDRPFPVRNDQHPRHKLSPPEFVAAPIQMLVPGADELVSHIKQRFTNDGRLTATTVDVHAAAQYRDRTTPANLTVDQLSSVIVDMLTHSKHWNRRLRQAVEDLQHLARRATAEPTVLVWSTARPNFVVRGYSLVGSMRKAAEGHLDGWNEQAFVTRESARAVLSLVIYPDAGLLRGILVPRMLAQPVSLETEAPALLRQALNLQDVVIGST